MKKDWSKIAVVVSCVLLIICLVQIMDMKQQIQNLQNNMSNRISNMENSVQNISSEVYRQLEREASLLTGSEWTYGERDMENCTVMLQCLVSPKEYQPEVTKAVLLCGDREYAMTLKNGAYAAEIPVPIFTESQVLRVQFKEDGVVRTEGLNWYLNPRYECLPTVYAEFGGGSSFRKNEDVCVLDMSGDLNIFMESKGGEFSIEKMYLVEHIEGQERSREEIAAEKMSVMDYYYQLEKKSEVPFGCTYDLYLEVVDNYGLVHRSWLEHKVIDEEGNPEEENSDWWYGSEGSLYDAQGEPLYVLENGTVVYAKEAVIKKNSLENYRDYLKKNDTQGTMHTLLRNLTGDEEQELIAIDHWEQDGQISVDMKVYTQKNGKVSCIYEEMAYNTHPGWNWLYLFEENDRTYLFKWMPAMWQGAGTYEYEIFSLTEKGEKEVIYSAAESYELPGDSSPEYKEVCERMRAFVEEVHGYQKASTPLIEIGDEYFENVEYNYVIECDELGVDNL